VAGDLTIEDGGTAEIHGMVIGDVVNRGRLELFGTVTGAVQDESGNGYVDVRSSVGG
jgi:hypothetical protein